MPLTRTAKPLNTSEYELEAVHSPDHLELVSQLRKDRFVDKLQQACESQAFIIQHAELPDEEVNGNVAS